MIKTTLFRLQKKILTSLSLIPLLLTACSAFDESAPEFFNKYAKIAYVGSVEKSRSGLSAAGFTQIDGSDDFTLTYNIVNPEKFKLTSEVTFPDGSPADSNYELGGDDVNTVTLTFRASFLAGVDGTDETSNISPTLKLFRKSDGYAQCYNTQKIKCNSPPDPITRAFSYMYSSGGTPSVNQRQVIAFDLPVPLKADVNLLTVSANGQTHYFDILSESPVGQSGDTWTIGNSSPALDSTVTGGSVESTNFYIITDIDNLTSLDVFDVVLTLTDTGGLSAEYTIPSRLRKLDSPTFTLVSPDSAAPEYNSYDQPYLVYTINNPESNPSDATLHFTVMDSASNIIADTDGNASEHIGTATFHLYPKKTGGELETYTISGVMATRDGWLDSEMTSDSKTVRGKSLTLETNIDADPLTGDRIINLGESYNLTSQDAAIITLLITKDGASIDISPNSGMGSFTYTFTSSGTYDTKVEVSADYYGSVSFPATIKVVDNTGGGITADLPKNVTFSYDSANKKITASDDDGQIADADLTDWSIELYYGAVSTGCTNSTNTEVEIPDSYPAGDYTLKVNVKYENNVYSGEIAYTKS